MRRYPFYDGIIMNNDVMDSQYDPLPILAQCSVCGMVNVLTSHKLEVFEMLRVPAQAD